MGKHQTFGTWLEARRGQVPPQQPELSSDPDYVLKMYLDYARTSRLEGLSPEEKESRFAEVRAALKKMRALATRYKELTGVEIHVALRQMREKPIDFPES